MLSLCFPSSQRLAFTILPATEEEEAPSGLGYRSPAQQASNRKPNLKRPVAQLPPGLSVSIDLNLQVLALRLSVGLTA